MYLRVKMRAKRGRRGRDDDRSISTMRWPRDSSLPVPALDNGLETLVYRYLVHTVTNVLGFYSLPP
jgi:hypothetical protein